MNIPPVLELENRITSYLSDINNLSHRIEQKEIEKQDLLNETALGIMDVIDSFERAEEGILEKGQNKNKTVAQTMKRYRPVLAKLFYLLNKQGITKIEFPENRLIPGLCEVVATEPDSSKENDEIISIVRNGYVREEKLIRAARIIVVKN